jgi:hypothetical protein
MVVNDGKSDQWGLLTCKAIDGNMQPDPNHPLQASDYYSKG